MTCETRKFMVRLGEFQKDETCKLAYIKRSKINHINPPAHDICASSAKYEIGKVLYSKGLQKINEYGAMREINGNLVLGKQEKGGI